VFPCRGWVAPCQRAPGSIRGYRFDVKQCLNVAMAWRVSAAALLVVVTTLVMRSHASSVEPVDGWDPASAARYLDARMDVWWTKAKVLRTGDGQARCLSCHTAVPYALTRPALRAVLGETAPTPHESRMLDLVRRRAGSTSADQPYYDHTEAKKIESRGVEAVLNAVVLTYLTPDSRSNDSDQHIQAAMTRLWQAQRPDGAWDWLEFGLEPYEAPDAVYYGATVAALAAGSDSGRRVSNDANAQAGVERLRHYLRSSFASQRLFNKTWALLAASRLDGVLTAAERTAAIADLESRQRADGGWSMADLGPWRWQRVDAPFAPPGQVDADLLAAPDGYATGLVVHALRRAGGASDRASIRKGQQWLRSQQLPVRADDPAWAPWRAHSLNFDREHGGEKGEPWRRMFMSDLATAFAALALLP
jgi:squalene-hopene/tetraprenyl-beta-curcumene cyclase